MPTLDEQYQQLVETAKADSAVLGLILGGSRGKGMTTEHSDYDILIIAEDAIVEGARIKYKSFSGPKFDINVMGQKELLVYGVWGSDTMWARYGFAHVQAVIDRKGDLQTWLSEQESIPLSGLDDAIKQSLDGYLNYTHRSLKNFRDLRNTAAHLAACDAVPLLITFLFAIEARVRPYNEYIEWELEKHPLKGLGMDGKTFSTKIAALLASGDQNVQKEFLALVQSLAQKNRAGAAVLESWKEYYFGE